MTAGSRETRTDQQRDFYNSPFRILATPAMQENVRDFYFRNIVSIINRNRRLTPPSKILEIGMGAGILAQKMSGHFSHCSFSGIDISEEQIKVARARGLNASVADIRNYQTPERYDLIYGSSVLHHLEDWPTCFTCMARALNSDGFILFAAEPLRYHLFYRAYHRIRGIWEIEQGMLKMSKTAIRNHLQNDFTNIKFYHYGNMFAYLVRPIGRIWHVSGFSRIPFLNDVYIYAEKK